MYPTFAFWFNPAPPHRDLDAFVTEHTTAGLVRIKDGNLKSPFHPFAPLADNS